MDQEIQRQSYRDVQTLLFCKISPTPPPPDTDSAVICDRLYQQIAQIKRSAAHAFLTFGGYDAICVYPTELGPNETTWLESIYRDKQDIIRMPSNNVMYHQMHLVSQHGDTREIWTVKDEEYPFFLATLIYGVNVEDLEREMEEESKQAAAEGFTIPSGVECSRYEQMIRVHLRQKLRREPVDVKYAVYNGITVSDVVILWRARDLREIMDLITYLEYSGIARKTLTTLGFPIQRNGQIEPCVIDTLTRNLHKTITVSMRGAIRNVKKFLDLQKILAEPQRNETTAKIRKELWELAARAYADQDCRNQLEDILRDVQAQDAIDQALKASDSPDAFSELLTGALEQALDNLSCALPERIWSQSLGKSDFTVSARVSYANLANLLEAYRLRHKDFYNACWEILTDVRKEQSSESMEWFRESKVPSDILSKLYADFQHLYEDGHELNLKQYSWANALQELLGSHHYIDHHPVLHGPSYLVYTSLKIAYAYLTGQVKDFEHLEQRHSLLKRSEENIIHFIQNLDQLTEQLSRNDDAMLNNRSNAHTIHFSLPESALEFYHAFLRRIVDYLMRYDDERGLKPANFEYDLLLSPKTCSGFQFRPILRTEHSDRGSRSNMVWPQKQAYVLELPLERIFKPLHVFFPVIHECFHVFGDVLRQRSLRRRHMAAFIASNLLNTAGFGQQRHSELHIALIRAIHAPWDTDSGDYLDSTCQQLRRNTYRLFDRDNQSDLEQYFTGPNAEQTLQLWETVRQRLSTIDLSTTASAEKTTVTDAILNNCSVFFKECYADAMSIALLNLTPREYLECSREFVSRYHNQHNSISGGSAPMMESKLTSPALRHAIVLAACCRMQHHLPHFSIRECTEAIEDFRIAKDETESEDGFGKLSSTLQECFYALVDMKLQMPAGSSLHPPVSLNYVIQYLTSCIELMYRDQPTLEPPDRAAQSRYAAYTLSNLSREFDFIIRRGNMFSKDFYDIIYEYHENIRRETNPKASN